jgi:hypothetical protein
MIVMRNDFSEKKGKGAVDLVRNGPNDGAGRIVT